jgi:alpha-glucosidase
VLDFSVAGAPGIRCVVNLGTEAVELPAGAVQLASGPTTAGMLPPDTAVWLTPDR